MKGRKQMTEIKERGITLIAIVVTIIVLIILATVSINMVAGENGLIKKAEQARDAYEESSKKEVEGLNTMLEEMMKETGKGPHGLPLVDTLGGGSSNVVLESTVDAEDVYGNKIVVPRGFFVRTDLGTSVNDGIVIEDKEGNQFVWIPCTKEQYENAKHAVMKESWSINIEYKTKGDNSSDENAPEGEKGQGYGWRDNYTAEDKTKLDATYKNNGNTPTLPTEKWVNEDQIEVATESIEKNGGFYIARYEAGIPSDATFSIKDSNLGYYTIEGASHTFTKEWANDYAKVRGSYGDTESIKKLKPVSKQGVQAWNYITQPNSKLVAENMYKDGDEVGVRSYLVDSQAWNHICKNIFDGRKNIKDSSSWGNYYGNTAPNYGKINGLYAKHTIIDNKWTIATTYTKGQVEQNTGTNYIELATGSSDDFKLYNIYDMAGNMWEWTTGHNIHDNQMFVVLRGGGFEINGATFPVVRAHGSDIITRYFIYVSFRVVLYVK